MLEIGEVLDNKYKILNKIGQGGMSIVYLAMNERANKQWAIKEVRKQGEENFSIVRQSLIMETEVLKNLKHKYLPAIVDIIEREDSLIIVMDYIEGMTLSQILAEERVIPQEKVIKYAIQLCEVLSYLHSQNPPIIYRDLKPGNIMIKPDDTITLIDFGTARRYNENNIADTTCLGTRGYAAPEQYQNENMKQSDARTDIYNLGATLYHLVTGKNPAREPYEIYPIRVWDSSLSAGLEKILIKCTQKNPNDRFATCEEVKQALENYSHLDEIFLQKQKKKLAVFLFFVVMSILSLSSLIYSIYKNRREINIEYNEYLKEAATESALTLNDAELNIKIIDKYNEAINLEPSRSEAYLRLLDYYISKGQKQSGILAISAMIASGNGNLMKNSDILYKMGTLYFFSDDIEAENVDYAAAYGYFSNVDFNKYPRAKYYASVSKALAEINIDWSSIVEELKAIKESLKYIEEIDEKVNTYITLANIYRNNALSISSLGINSYEEAINILKELEELLGNIYIEDDIINKYMPGVQFYLADSLYRKSMLSSEKDKDSLTEAIKYYKEYINYAQDENSIVYRNRIADIYRQLEMYNKAADEYLSIIRDFPKDELAYLNYTSMLLSEMKNIDEASYMYEEMKKIDGIEENSNFKSIKRKLEAINSGENNE